MSGHVFKCSGTIESINKETFRLLSVTVDNELWSEKLPLVAKYEDVKDGIITKINDL